VSEKTKVDLERAEARLQQTRDKQREGAKAMSEYEAARVALNDRTVKLRALRLEREAAEAETAAAAPPKPAKVTKAKAAKAEKAVKAPKAAKPAAAKKKPATA
jgi:hypothetical protein